MPAVALDTTSHLKQNSTDNALPALLKTPNGLAIVEVQGTINTPILSDTNDTADSSEATQTTVGRLEFPLYRPNEDGDQEGKWMKKVYLYIGRFQRLTGEVKKLNKPLVVIAKPQESISTYSLEVLEVVKYKILFSGRPEPVGE